MKTKTTDLKPGDTLDDGDVVITVINALPPAVVATLKVVRGGATIETRYAGIDAEHTVVAKVAKLAFKYEDQFGGEPMGPIWFVSDKGDRTRAVPEWVVVSVAQDYANRLGVPLEVAE